MTNTESNRPLFLTVRYMDVVMSLNNSKLVDYVDRIYIAELEI